MAPLHSLAYYMMHIMSEYRNLLDNSVDHVCTEAFQQAKHRMIATRENLKSDFIRSLGTFVITDTET